MWGTCMLEKDGNIKEDEKTRMCEGKRALGCHASGKRQWV